MKLLLGVLLLTAAATADSAIMRGQDGRWYGNLCVTQMGVHPVPWQPVGSICYVPGYNIYGFIANS